MSFSAITMQSVRTIASTNYSALTCLMRQRLLGSCSTSLATSNKRHLSSNVLSTPTPDGACKVYPEKIEVIVSQISQLTLLEVADLNDLLKKKLNISDAPVMAFGAGMPMPGAAAQEDDDEEAAAPTKVQTSFTVKMNKFDAAKKVAVIKEVKALLEGFNLVQAKKFVESCPAVVKEDIPKDEAEKLAAALNAAGAECVVE